MMRRAATIALFDKVLEDCGVSSAKDLADLVNCEDGAAIFLSMCRAAASRPQVASLDAPATTAVNVVLQVAAPPPPPITVNVVLQIPMPAVLTATVGIQTVTCRMRNAQAQTSRSLNVEATTAVQTVATALSMVDGSTTMGGIISTVNQSTDTYMDRLRSGLSHTSTQTEGDVVSELLITSCSVHSWWLVLLRRSGQAKLWLKREQLLVAWSQPSSTENG